jgi:hypothetical protein
MYCLNVATFNRSYCPNTLSSVLTWHDSPSVYLASIWTNSFTLKMAVCLSKMVEYLSTSEAKTQEETIIWTLSIICDLKYKIIKISTFQRLAVTNTRYKQERQCMHKHNIEACSCNHCCHGKAINITYSECVSVALVTQHKMHVRHIVICDLSGSTIFFHINS